MAMTGKGSTSSVAFIFTALVAVCGAVWNAFGTEPDLGKAAACLAAATAAFGASKNSVDISEAKSAVVPPPPPED